MPRFRLHRLRRDRGSLLTTKEALCRRAEGEGHVGAALRRDAGSWDRGINPLLRIDNLGQGQRHVGLASVGPSLGSAYFVLRRSKTAAPAEAGSLVNKTILLSHSEDPGPAAAGIQRGTSDVKTDLPLEWGERHLAERLYVPGLEKNIC